MIAFERRCISWFWFGTLFSAFLFNFVLTTRSRARGWAAMSSSWQSGYIAMFSCINWAVPAAAYFFRNAWLADRRGGGVETALLDFRL